MPGFKGLSEGKMLKESVDEGFLEDLSKSSNSDLADWAKTTLAEYNKLMDKYYHGPIDERLGFKNFSERLNKLFSQSNEEVRLSTVIWLDGSGKVHEDQFNYDEVSKEASERYNTPVDQLTDLDIVGGFLYKTYPRFRITPFIKILKDGDNKEEIAAELKKKFNKKS